MCVFVHVAQRGEGIRSQHTDEVPACADQITQPTLSFSVLVFLLVLTVSLLLLYFCAGKQPAIPQCDAK